MPANPFPTTTKLALAALVALLGVSAVPGRARADVPRARLAIGSGLRLNFGELGNDFAWGWQIINVDAALLPASWLRGQLRLGVGWWTTISRFGATSSTAVDDEVSFLQMGLAPRLDVGIPLYGFPLSAHVLVGYEFMRASHPVPPDGQGSYHGLATQFGLTFGRGSAFWGAQATWDPILSGPQGVYVLAFVGLGAL